MCMKLMTCYLDDDDGKSYPEKLQEIFFRISPYIGAAIIFVLVIIVFCIHKKMAEDKEDEDDETDTLLI